MVVVGQIVSFDRQSVWLARWRVAVLSDALVFVRERILGAARLNCNIFEADLLFVWLLSVLADAATLL